MTNNNCVSGEFLYFSECKENHAAEETYNQNQVSVALYPKDTTFK